MGYGNDILSKIIDSIFNLSRTNIYLIAIFALAFILRLIAAINLGVSADDMHFVTHAINFLSADKLVTWSDSSGLWHLFTDLMYKIFGLTQLGSRIAALIFGSFSIFVIYLLSREFFDEKISLTAAFLLAIAPFHIKLTIAEMDVMAMFFVLLGMLLFIRGLKTNKTAQFALSGLFIGLAIYTKVYPILFIPSLLLYGIYCKKKSKMDVATKENAKKIFIFLLFIFIFTIPALTHNYLLYKDKGFLDLQFTRTFGLGRDISAQYYSWDHQFNAKNDWGGLVFGNSTNSGSPLPTLLQATEYIRVGDPINFYLGIIGLLILILYRNWEKSNRQYVWFFLLSILFVLPFLASIILLPKHYVFLEILMAPLSAVAINRFNQRFFKSHEKSIKIILILIMIISLVFLSLPNKNTNTHFYGKSAVAQVIDFKENIPKDSIVVGDSRIYRGQIHWMLQGRPYLEGSDFIEIIKQQENLPGDYVSMNVYYVECVKDDCGWGGIENQQEFNATMEALTSFFKSQGNFIKSVNEPDRFSSYYPFQEKNKIDTFNIYSARVQLKSSVLALASEPKEWFLYKIGYYPLEKNFDYYTTSNFIDYLLDKIAHLIVSLAIFFAIGSTLYVLYLTIKDSNREELT